MLLPSAVTAHGINGHVWVSDVGADALPECEVELRELFADPLLREKYQFGAAFPDSGYAPGGQRDYGEAIHWEPFIQHYIEYLRDKYKGNFESQAAQEEVAFLLGAAQHGMEDEVFDSIFMPRAEEVDGAVQDDLDTGTDLVLVGEGYTDLTPEIYYPQDITVAYASYGIDVDNKAIDHGVRIIRTVVIGLVDATPENLGAEYYDVIPWALDNYLDPDTHGSHAFEQHLVAPYVVSLWHRLHDRFQDADMIIGSAPRPGKRLPNNAIGTVDSWVTVFFGIGLMTRTLTPDTVKVYDAIGEPIPVEIGWTRWGGPDSDTRLVQIRPVTDWTADGDYTIEFSPDIERIDGETLGKAFMWKFRTACADGGYCPALEEPETPPSCVVLPDKKGCGVTSAQDQTGMPVLAVLAGVFGMVYFRRTAKTSTKLPRQSDVLRG